MKKLFINKKNVMFVIGIAVVMPLLSLMNVRSIWRCDRPHANHLGFYPFSLGAYCHYGPDVFSGQNTPVVFSHALVVQLCDQSASRVDTQISYDELSLFFKEKSDRPFPNLQQRYL